jgi:MFS family permease
MTTQLLTRPAAKHAERTRRRRLPTPVAFALLASTVLVFLAGSSAPTPLYAVYQREWHFSPITTTVVFGVYAIAVLSALLVVGSISDHIGRRPVLLAAIAVQAVTMWIFATADGVPQLFAARVVQGLSTGAALGAIGAGLLDLDKARGAVANAVAPMSGTALGALVSGLLVQFLPMPTKLVYLVLFGILVLQWIGVALMGETVTRRPGALASLKVAIGLPAAIRGPMLAAAPVLLAVWSLGGFYASLGPALTRQVVGSGSPVLGGGLLFVIAGVGALSVLLLRNLAADRMMQLGIATLAAGVAVTLFALAAGSTVAFVAGALLAGVGFGTGVQGAIRTVVPLAAAHQRAGVLSLVFVLSYLGLGVPAVIAGYLVVHGGGLHETAEQYGVAVIGLAAAAALVLGARSRTAKTR